MTTEKTTKTKDIKEIKNFFEISHLNIDNLPRILIYLSLDSFEFDLLVDHYREKLYKLHETYEFVVYVSEPGDQEKLFSELFNFSMFSCWKLVIIKFGSSFFQPILSPSKKEIFENFKNSIPNIDEKIFLLIHYDSKELPTKLVTLFNNKFAILKSRNYYPEERRKALEEILKNEKVSLEPDAIDEFIHRVTPHIGSYIKNIRKIKNLLNKKNFTLEDIREVLFPSSEFNPFQLVESIFKNDKVEFYKEFYKIKPHEDSVSQILAFLSVFVNRLDEVRKAKILFQKYPNEQDSEEFFRQMNMSSYSEPRKRFVKNRLKKESALFSDEIVSYAYQIAIDINIHLKTSSLKDINYFFIPKFNSLFLLLSSRNFS